MLLHYALVVVLQAEEAKHFCALANTAERQESNFYESDILFADLKEKGLAVTADIMNGYVFHFKIIKIIIININLSCLRP